MVARETLLADGLARLGLPASDQAISRLALLVDLLENRAMGLGFLGPNEGPRLIPRHVLESAALLPLLVQDGPIVDVGSGAGLPGLVLGALGRRVTLLESLAKRAGFLRLAVDALAIDADVVQARAEEAGRSPRRESYRYAVARALAEPAVAMELCLPFVEPGGGFAMLGSPGQGDDRSAGALTTRSSPAGSAPMADAAPAKVPGSSRGAGADASGGGAAGAQGPSREIEWEDPSRPAEGPRTRLAKVAALVGGGAPRWIAVQVPGVRGRRWVMMVDKLHSTSARFPRRPGVPKRRPLGGDGASVN